MSTVSLLVTTVSRPTLAKTLASLRKQPWLPGDEVLLVGDGPNDQARELWDQFGLPGRYEETPARSNDWGHTPRNLFMPRCRGDLIAHLDDDDVWNDGALNAVRRAALDRVHVFRMDAKTWMGKVLWEERVLRHRNVGTPMVVVPRVGPGWAEFAPRYGGDFDFVRDTVALWEGAVEWHEDVICTVRPR
jgi:glycosyltransferase involved in cell wall biosynthesis